MFASSAEALRAGLMSDAGGQWLSRPVLRRRAAAPTAFAAPEDFTLGPARPVAPDLAGLTPYCLDPAAGRLWLCDVPAGRLSAGAAFAYAMQRAEATRLVSVPLGAAMEGDDGAVPLLSIGRCGSTLAGHVLAAAGATVVTEIDAFTGLGDLARRWPAETAIGARLAHAADLAFAALPRGAVVKMRSQATMAARAILRRRRGILLVRDLQGWHASMARKFPTMSPDDLARDLSDALRAASDVADRLTLVTYDRLLADPAGVAASVLARDVSRHAGDIAACLARDSQQGTALARDAGRGGSHDETAAFLDIWRARAPRDALHRLGLTPMLALTPARPTVRG